MRKEFKKACSKYGAKFTFQITPSYRAFEIPVKHTAMLLAKKAAQDIGIKPNIIATGGGSDANIFSSFSLPCLIIGVGADNVHTKKENIAVNEMEKGAQLLLNIIKESVNCSKKR
jgi:tripeptide aminopeptidase